MVPVETKWGEGDKQTRPDIDLFAPENVTYNLGIGLFSFVHFRETWEFEVDLLEREYVSLLWGGRWEQDGKEVWGENK